MVRNTLSHRFVTLVLLATMVTSAGCRQVARRSASPTPLPTYDAAPTMPTMPTLPAMPNTPELSPIPPLPGQEANIPPVPPSTALAPRLEDHFGFTEPKLPESESLPSLALPPVADDPAHDIQPTGSDESAAVADADFPVLTPLSLPTKTRMTAPVELDQSLFLMDLFEDAELVIPTEKAVPTTVNGLTIQPWNPERQMTGTSRDPQPWPAEGVTPTLTITPGPVHPKWTSEPLPTRPANSRPRRLMIENSDSAIRPIE